MSQESGLELRGFRLLLRGEALFQPLTLRIAPGEVAAITGPSGCGKSSLLLALAGLLEGPFRIEGEAFLDGRPLNGLLPERRHLGLIFQDPLLLPHLSVAQNLAFGLSRRNAAGRRQRAQLIAEALQQIRLDGFGERDPASLSGGQRARVALMRSLLSQPKALLLDEPFASLDPELRQDMRRFLADLLLARRLPALLVTHDRQDAEALARQRFLLKNEHQSKFST